MPLAIELFGIARARAGVAQTVVDGLSLGEALVELAERYPLLAESCIDQRRLRPGFAMSLNGEKLLNDPDAKLSDGQTLLLFSVDAGG